MPNLAKLAQEGVSGKIRSAKPIASPRIWNTIATGKTPEKHGILHFSRKDSEEKHHLFMSTDRKVHALWNIASSHRKKVAVVNFWNTFPPEKLNGIMVSDHLLASEIAGFVELLGTEATPSGSVIYPEDWQDRLSPLVADTSPVTAISNPFAKEHPLPSWATRRDLARYFYEDGALTRIGMEIERVLEPDLLMILLPGVDRVSHFLWGVLEPAEEYPPELRPTPQERSDGKRAILTYYEYADALIGKLLARAGPRDMVIVVSDHGFEAGRALRFLTGVHESEDALDGILFASGPGITAGSRTDNVSVADITPSILAWMGLPVARDMDGKVASFLEIEHKPMIASHDVGNIEFLETAPSGVEQDIVEQLRSLGYLEGE